MRMASADEHELGLRVGGFLYRQNVPIVSFSNAIVRTMEEVRFMTTWEQRFFSHLFNAFAIAAVLLACLGLSLGVARALASALYAVPPSNPSLIAATATVLAISVLTASYLRSFRDE